MQPRLRESKTSLDSATGSRGQAAGRRSNIKAIVIFSFTLLVSCGFHLRGLSNMPPWLQCVAIVSQDVHRELTPLIKKQLQAYHIRVLPDSKHADYILILEQDSNQQQITNVSASTAPRQYQLIYKLQFKLVNAKGEELLPSHHVISTRQLTVNNDRILASNSEETLLFGEMRRDASIELVSQLSRACHNLETV